MNQSACHLPVPVLLLFALTLNGFAASYQSDSLSPGATISLLTASPGEELYSVFGHSALRVYDPVHQIDEVYNYGTFDFDTPNFYWKFTRGKLLYQLSVSSLSAFLGEYQYEGRAVYEQVLALDPDEMQRLYHFLQINRLPENRDYLYDFFFDNCATRIRDVIDNYVDIVWADDVFRGPPRSFRDMLHPYLGNLPWPAFGIDLALGLPSDRVARPWEYMFLPDEMFMAFAHARRTDGRPLVQGFRDLLQETLEREEPPYLTPNKLMWIIFLIRGLSFFSRRFSRGFDLVYFSLLGVGGLLIAFLWFLSDHDATNNNLVLLWMLPTHLYFIFGTLSSSPRRMVMYYFRVVFGINLLLLAFWLALPQDFNEAFFPLILIAAAKAFSIGFRPRRLYPLSTH
ncbi:MAG: DUF4105 domain-containing protein [Bacteroidales bacterium]